MALSVYAQPSVTLLANSYTGKPGDTITFTYSYDLDGQTFDRTEIKFDGARLDRVDGAINNDGEFIWTATPGTHVFRIYLRTLNGEVDPSGNPIKIMRHDLAVVQISGWETNQFSHPGLSLSNSEIDVIKKNVFGSDPHPMKHGWNTLPGKSSYTPNPHATLQGDGYQKDWDNDGKMLYRIALKWAIGGEDKYGDAAVRILNGWASTCKQLWYEDGSVYPFLHITHFMHDWLESAELLKHYNGGYTGWSDADIKKFDDQYVRGILVPMALAWWGNIGNPYATQNQPLNVAKSRIMLGIYLDDKALFQSGYDHLVTTMHGDHYGNYWYKDIFGYDSVSLMELSIGPNGEYMEINRDPAPNSHWGMCKASTQLAAEVLWHQGYDIYDMIFHNEVTPRFLQGQKWIMKGTLGGGITMSKNGETVDLNGDRNYEIIYNHYQHRQGGKYEFPLLEQYVAQKRAGGEDSINSSYESIAVLTHADLSKDQTKNQVHFDKIEKINFSVNITNTGMLLLNYNCFDKNAQVKLFDLSGRLLFDVDFSKAENKNVSLEGLRKGVYMIRLKSTAGTVVKKVLYK